MSDRFADRICDWTEDGRVWRYRGYSIRRMDGDWPYIGTLDSDEQDDVGAMSLEGALRLGNLAR